MDVIDDMSEVDGELLSLIERIRVLAAPETGIVHNRRAYLGALTDALTISGEATQALAQIAASAQAQGVRALGSVKEAGTTLVASARQAGDQMRMIAGTTIAVFLASLVLTWGLILRPMGRVTQVTERLATGNLEPVTGFETQPGGIAILMPASLLL